MDFLQALRMRNLFQPDAMPPMDLFSPQPNSTGNMQQWMQPAPQFDMPQVPQGGMGGDYDVNSRMSQLYHPEHEMTDKYNAMLNNYPQFQEPSKLRKIAAAILGSVTDLGNNLGVRPTGIKGSNVFDEFTGRNSYLEHIADWKNQITPFQHGADLERQSNVNNRTLAYQTVNQELRDRQLDITSTKNANDAKIKEQRANIYDFKTKHPNMRFIMPKGGNIIAVNPADGSQLDTGVPTGTLSDMDKMDFNHDYRSLEIAQRGDESRKTADEQHVNRTQEIGQRGEESRKTKETPSGSVGRTGELPTQTRVRQATAARELYNTKPELRPFIKMGQGNEFEIVPPGKNFWGTTGPTQEQYDTINKAIYGEGQPTINQPTRTGTPAPTTSKGVPTEVKLKPTNKPTEAGYVKVFNAVTGEEVAQIPQEQASKIDKTKYRVQ